MLPKKLSGGRVSNTWATCPSDRDNTGKLVLILDTVGTPHGDPRKGGVMLLLENSAGAGNAVGTSLEEIGLLLKAMPDSEQWLGLCFDTAHAYGAGYDLRSAEAVGSVVDLIDAQIGLGRLRVIHGNDTDVELGSKVDRHQNLGQGNIGWDGFTAIISEPRLSHVAFILETPDVNTEADAENMKRLKAIRESNA